MKNILTFFAVFLMFSLTAFAQKENEDEKDFDVDFDDNGFWSDFDEVDWKFGMFERDAIESVPTIEINYDFAQPKFHEDAYNGDFMMTNGLETRLGFTEYFEFEHSPTLIEYDFGYFMLKNFNADYGSNEKDDISDVAVEAWRFGVGNSSGYGWRLGEKQFIILYHDDGMNWTQLDFQDDAPDSLSQYRLDRFGDSFRFGTHFSGGIKVRLFHYISLDGGFERSVVFPRHMFWYWSASELLEAIAHGGTDILINEIEKSSPKLVPLVNFILKNAVSYGAYELRSKYMNWPVETAAPFMFDTYKVGISFQF